ncbi:conserved phage C-terminal domain-containing protein [Companilactobacillus jidongensis]|uniref:conserved phage C-terminal domain-containing protein n=1 Tax=Companilactobacillus jidongensis TaxID=2486006 RepID=UPI001CDB97B7|nr:conserved phage C-terminal domain-containing protein [Companilactobacillus jidongensis]
MLNNYFSHDSNARNSTKLSRVRMKYGAEGYGTYFMILERLRDEDDYTSIRDYNTLAYDLRVDTSIIKAIVEDFGLFVFTDDGKYFYSEGFKKRMALKDSKSKKLSDAGKRGANKRWGNSKVKENSKGGNSHPIATPPKNDGKRSKEKESKENSKDNVEQAQHDIPFKSIIDYLNSKTGKHFRSAETNNKYIRARWNDGYRLDDFKKVIDNKCTEWLKDTSMNKYLRPETLFGTKFEGYLNSDPEPNQSSNWNNQPQGYEFDELPF